MKHKKLIAFVLTVVMSVVRHRWPDAPLPSDDDLTWWLGMFLGTHTVTDGVSMWTDQSERAS